MLYGWVADVRRVHGRVDLDMLCPFNELRGSMKSERYGRQHIDIRWFQYTG